MRKAHSAITNFTEETKRAAKAQLQAEQALARQKERIQAKQAKTAKEYKRIERMDSDAARRASVQAHSVTMRGYNDQARALKQKVQLQRAAEREEAQRHSKIMRRYREEATARAKETAKLDRSLAKRGLFLDPDLDTSSGLKRAYAERAHRRRVGRLTAGANAFGTTLGVATGAAGLAGGFAILGGLYSQQATNANAAKLANQGFNEKSGITREQKKAQILALTRGTNDRYGVSQDDMIAGMGAFVDKTGNVDQAMKMADFMAKLSGASGTDITELGTVLGNAYSNLSKQKGVTQEEAFTKAQSVARVFAGQGKAGAVELKDMAARAPILTAAAGSFEGDLEKNMGVIGALTQIAVDRGGAANADVASTAMKNIALDIAQKAKKIGVTDAIGKDGMHVKDPVETIANVIDKSGGSLAKLQKVFGRETLPGINGLAKAYVDAGKGEDGKQAIRDLVKEYTSQSYSEKEMNDSSAFRSRQDDRKLDRAIGQFNAMVSDELSPVFGKLAVQARDAVPAVAGFVEMLGSFVEYAAENPFDGLSIVFAAALSKELAGIGLAKVFQSQLGAMFGSGAMTFAGMYGVVKMAELTIQNSVQKSIDKDNKRLEDLVSQARDEKEKFGSVSEDTQSQLERARENLTKRHLNARVNDSVRGEMNWAEQDLADLGGIAATGANKVAELFTGNKRSVSDTDYRDNALKEKDFENLDDLSAKIAMLSDALSGFTDAQRENSNALAENTQAVASGGGSGGGNRSGGPITSD